MAPKCAATLCGQATALHVLHQGVFPAWCWAKFLLIPQRPGGLKPSDRALIPSSEDHQHFKPTRFGCGLLVVRFGVTNDRRNSRKPRLSTLLIRASFVGLLGPFFGIPLAYLPYLSICKKSPRQRGPLFTLPHMSAP